MRRQIEGTGGGTYGSRRQLQVAQLMYLDVDEIQRARQMNQAFAARK
jgi:hypothetical protein